MKRWRAHAPADVMDLGTPACRALTSPACLPSHCAKLLSRGSGAAVCSTTSVLHALHCCTACLQSLQTHAAAHRIWGYVLMCGCSRAIDRPSRKASAVSCKCSDDTRQNQQQKVYQTVSRRVRRLVTCHCLLVRCALPAAPAPAAVAYWGVFGQHRQGQQTGPLAGYLSPAAAVQVQRQQ
jgi:hypothetical protein